MPFRFEQVGAKNQPLDFFNFDRAIDQLGRVLLAMRWSEMVEYSPSPFTIKDRDQIRYRFDNQGRLIRTSQRLTMFERLRLRRHSSAYKKVIKKMSDAIQCGDLTLYCISREGEIKPVPHRGIAAAQKMRIFYTGTITLETNRIRRPWRVLVAKTEFLKWLENPDRPAQRDGRPSGAARILRLLPDLAAHVSSKGYLLAKEPFQEFLSKIDPALNEPGFEKVWRQRDLDPVRQTRGRRTQASIDSFQADLSNLRALLSPPTAETAASAEPRDESPLTAEIQR